MKLPLPSSLRRRTRFGALLAVAVAVSACGGSSGSSSSSATEPATTATTGRDPASLAAGKKVFLANCGVCHSLAAAGTSGGVGPDLDDLEPDAAAVANQVTNGGGGMPAFGNQLSEAQIQAVAQYVSTEAGRS